MSIIVLDMNYSIHIEFDAVHDGHNSPSQPSRINSSFIQTICFEIAVNSTIHGWKLYGKNVLLFDWIYSLFIR